MDLLFHSTDRPTSLHDRDGLSNYLAHTVKRPDMLPDAEYAAMTDQDRAAYNRARIIYASSYQLETPHVGQARELLHSALSVNLGRNSGHNGVILSGDSTIGKTETTKCLMRDLYARYVRMNPAFDSAADVPIVYISVPAASTGKLLMQTFANFLNLPYTSSESMGTLRLRVVKALAAANTQLIVVDELQNLAGRSIGLGESVNVLKNLHNEVAATFVYAGIGLIDSALLKGANGQQMRGRFSVLDMMRLDINQTDDRQTWARMVNGFEKRLPLRHQEPGTLKDLRHYLYLRTSGSIGSLARLLTAATVKLIDNSHNKYPEERLTETLLATIRIDEYAEEQYKKHKAALRLHARSTKSAPAAEVAS